MASRQFNAEYGLSVGNGSAIINVVDANANANLVALTANGNISFTGSNVSLGTVNNLRITGGSSGQYLQTDGSGGLSWQAISGGSSISNGNSNVSIPAANGNINISATGTTNVVVVTSTGANITGNLTVSTGSTVSRFNPRVNSQANAATTITPNISSFDMYVVTAQNGGNIALGTPTGTPVQGNKLIFRFKDNGTVANIQLNSSYRAIGVTIPTTTVANKITYLGCIYNSDDTIWDVIAVNTQA